MVKQILLSKKSNIFLNFHFPNPTEQVQQQQQQQQQLEAKRKASSKRNPIPKFNFKSSSSKRPDKEGVIDPELDLMLAELETDEDFQKMSDNEQVNKLAQSCNKNPKTQKKTRQPYNFLLTQ